MKGRHVFNENVEMYLKTIAVLSEVVEPVPVPSIAKFLGISTVSASEMIHRLQDRGLLKHIPYKGVRLTEEGRRRANGVIRRHRLWECFLTSKLGIPWDRVYNYACRLEHTTNQEVTQALANYLGNPAICPHGNPIPSVNGQVSSLDGVSLTHLTPGEGGVIQGIRPQGDYEKIYRYLAERNLRPGSVIEVEKIEPFGGSISIRVNEETHVLQREIASQILLDTEGSSLTGTRSATRQDKAAGGVQGRSLGRRTSYWSCSP